MQYFWSILDICVLSKSYHHQISFNFPIIFYFQFQPLISLASKKIPVTITKTLKKTLHSLLFFPFFPLHFY